MLTAETWVEKFTGLSLKTGEPSPLDLEGYEELTGLKLPKEGKVPADLETAGSDAEKEVALKKALLAEAHQTIATIKYDFQSAMTEEVKVKEKLFKEKLLAIDGTQLDEADFDDIDWDSMQKQLDPKTTNVIAKGSQMIASQGERLKAATIERNGRVEPLFNRAELEDEYWFPINRERILPETFIGNLYSKTQRMREETDTAYLEGVEQKKQEGGLTPKLGLVRGVLEAGSDFASLGSDMAGAFGNGTPDAKLAAEILDTMSGTFSTSADVYDKLKAKEFGDASKLALGGLSTISSMILGQAGVPKDTIDIVKTGFSAGQSAVTMGQKLAQGPKGVAGALDIFSGILKDALTVAASKTNDPAVAQALKIAAAAGPTALQQAAKAADLYGKAKTGDIAGVIDGLTQASVAFLSSVQTIETLTGASEKTVKDTETATKYVKMGGEALGTVATAAESFKKGDFTGAISSIIGALGNDVATVLTDVKVDPKEVALIQGCFAATSSFVKVGAKLAEGPRGVGEAMDVFAAGLQDILTKAANSTNDPTAKKALLEAGAAAPAVLATLGTGATIIDKLQSKDIKGALECLTKASVNIVATVERIRALETSDEGQKEAIGKESEALEKVISQSGDMLGATVVMVIMLKQGNYAGAINSIVKAIGDNLTEVLTEAGVDPGVAKQIGNLYGAAADTPTIIQALASNPPKLKEALGTFGGAMKKAFQGAAPNNGALQAAGGELALAFEGLGAASEVKKLYSEGKYEEGAKLFLETTKSQLSGIFKLTGVESSESTEDEGGEEEDEESGGEDEGKKAEGEISSEVSPAAAKGLKALKLAASTSAGELTEGLKVAKQKDAEEEAQQILEASKAEVVAITEAEKLGIEASDIDTLIGEMMRDRMIMKTATMIMSGGAAFLAKFVPGLGAVSVGIKMAASMVSAGQRAQQLSRWVNNQKDFAAAQSALTSSSQNFVKNQAEQFAHYSIQAAFQAAQMIGNVVKASGIGAAAGQALETVGDVGAKLEDIILKWKKRADLEKAWRITKKSLTTPTNRKLALRARALNPTLAKYSIAWGAVKLRDPLARNAVAACNLTEAVLNNEKSNISKVVDYLEKFYEDDDKLYREVEEQAKWAPTSVTLDLRCWGKIKKLAVDNIKLQNPDTGALDGQLALLKVDIAKLDANGVAQRIEILTSVRASFNSYVPQAPGKKDVEAMRKVIALMVRQVEDALKNAEARAKEWEDGTIAKQEEDAKKEREERAKKLAVVDNAVKEIESQLELLETFDLDDSVNDMEVGKVGATALVDDIMKIDELLVEKKIETNLKTLRAKIQSLTRLIEQMKAAGAE